MQGFDLSTISNCYIGGAQASAIYLGSSKIWPATQHDYSQDPLTFEVLEAGQFKYDAASNYDSLQPELYSPMHYSLDNGATWNDIQDNVWTATIPAGSKIIFNCIDPSVVMGWGIGTFSSTGRFNVSGNILSLINGIDFNNGVGYTLRPYEFARLFYGCQYLISAKNLILPTQTIIYACYQEMFRGCTSLTSAPALPATTLADFCYSDMFNGCTSLTTAPALPATTLAITCYGRMFNGCTSLATAPALPATTLANSCYINMFSGCTSLTSAPALPATTLTLSCYNQMFKDCTSLTSAPVLPATTLAQTCYANMFRNCTSLTSAPSILPATTLAPTCYGQMFYNCTSLTTAPVLPAPVATNFCYTNMFYMCANLNSVTCLATDISASNCTTNWLAGVSATGTFTKAASMNDWTTDGDGIPSGWSVVNAS